MARSSLAIPAMTAALLGAMAIGCGGGGGTEGGESTELPTYAPSPEQAALLSKLGTPEYLTISFDPSGRREEAWSYLGKVRKTYIFWDGARVREKDVKVSAGKYSNPASVDPTRFTSATTRSDVERLFGVDYANETASKGSFKMETRYYKSLGLVLSFQGDTLVQVQGIDR